MNNDSLIAQFADRHAPPARHWGNEIARHTTATLSEFLNVEPEEVIALCEAGLLQASEPWPGAPSLRFSNQNLYALRRELARQHAADTIELCKGKPTGEVRHVMELSWQKRREKVVELARKT